MKYFVPSVSTTDSMEMQCLVRLRTYTLLDNFLNNYDLSFERLGF
jgi:hypothetical protein